MPKSLPRSPHFTASAPAVPPQTSGACRSPASMLSRFRAPRIICSGNFASSYPHSGPVCERAPAADRGCSGTGNALHAIIADGPDSHGTGAPAPLTEMFCCVTEHATHPLWIGGLRVPCVAHTPPFGTVNANAKSLCEDVCHSGRVIMKNVRVNPQGNGGVSVARGSTPWTWARSARAGTTSPILPAPNAPG